MKKRINYSRKNYTLLLAILAIVVIITLLVINLNNGFGSTSFSPRSKSIEGTIYRGSGDPCYGSGCPPPGDGSGSGSGNSGYNWGSGSGSGTYHWGEDDNGVCDCGCEIYGPWSYQRVEWEIRYSGHNPDFGSWEIGDPRSCDENFNYCQDTDFEDYDDGGYCTCSYFRVQCFYDEGGSGSG